MNLSEIIIKKINDDGPISFHDFMEMALYYPSLGYYTSSQKKIGATGDYYTAPYLTNLFGEMIGKQIEEMWCLLNKKKFTILEYGGGNGTLCFDILAYLKDNVALYNELDYFIIEKVPTDLQKKIPSEKIKWIKDLGEIGQISGCILSNELVDNFPVHQVVMQDELKEIFIDHQHDQFIEILKPATDELKNYFSSLNVKLANGFRTEVNLWAKKWIKEISTILQKGFILTIDYGYRSIELYQPTHSSGTVMCYHKHTTNEYPYQNIGEQDITAHVNFSALAQFGKEKGLDYCGYSTQTGFLLSLGLVTHLKKIEEKNTNMIATENKMVLLYTLLMDMGKKFKILIQKKGLENIFLSGMRFSQPVI